MAILMGFPPSNTISPSVRITEKDLSFIAPDQSFHRAGLVGFASKGPINIPTIIRTQSQLNRVFGFPHPDMGDPYLIYAASQYLLVANELYVVRVANVDAVDDEAASTAYTDVQAAGTVIAVESLIPGDYTTATDMFFKWKLNGILASKTLVLPYLTTSLPAYVNTADEIIAAHNTVTGTWITDDIVYELNDQLNDQDGIVFYATDDDRLGIRTTFAYGPDASLEFVSVTDQLVGKTINNAGVDVVSPVYLGLGMTAGTTTSDNDRYPIDGSGTESGHWDLDGIDPMTLVVVVSGTDNVLIDNVAQTIHFYPSTEYEANYPDQTNTTIDDLMDVTTTELVAYIAREVVNKHIAGFVASDSSGYLKLSTLTSGKDARILVKSNSTLNDVFGFSNITNDGVSSALQSPIYNAGTIGVDDAGIVYGDANVSGDPTFTITADSAGIEGNNTAIVVVNDIREGTFRIEVYNNEVQTEAWGYLTKMESSRYYVETYLSLVSDYIRCIDDTSTGAPPLNGTYYLSGGQDGIPADPDEQDSLLIGGGITGSFEGIYALSEPEQIDIDIIAVPGHASTTVVSEVLNMCQYTRMDCMAIIDPPFGLTVKEIIQWQNGTHPLNTDRFNSDFGALYWPWVKLRDNYNQIDVWVPPSGSIMAVYARSDFLAAPWYAPAGVTRGIVPGITDVFNRPTLEERDSMYGNRNCINPIVQFSDIQDFTVWGQKTLQRSPTALDRVNVRRLMFVVEKRIRQKARYLLFEPHDQQLRDQFIDMATGILQEIQRARGITAFIIKCDTEINTPDVIDRNEMRARIGIQPVRAAEFIFIEFSIHRTGDWGPYWAGTANSGNLPVGSAYTY